MEVMRGAKHVQKLSVLWNRFLRSMFSNGFVRVKPIMKTTFLLTFWIGARESETNIIPNNRNQASSDL